MLKNFKDLANEVGVETPHQIGRAVYKGTGCGPWMVFLTREAPARDIELVAVVREGENGVYVDIPADADKELLEYVQFLGFSPTGKIELTDAEKKMREYRKTIRKYQHAKATTPDKRVLRTSFENGVLTIRNSYRVPATIGEIYYEDDAANNLDSVDKIVGVKIGSIVEGSDVSVGSYELMFPFTKENFWETVEGVNKEASFYWDRDNADHYELVAPDGGRYYAVNSWGNWDWGEGIPEPVRALIEERLESGEQLEEEESVMIVTDEGNWALKLSDVSMMTY